MVNNDDVVRPGSGFETHPHRDMEIVTWVLQGSLVHQDSTGHSGVIYLGLAQRMSAGAGILHTRRRTTRGGWSAAARTTSRCTSSRCGWYLTRPASLHLSCPAVSSRWRTWARSAFTATGRAEGHRDRARRDPRLGNARNGRGLIPPGRSLGRSAATEIRRVQPYADCRATTVMKAGSSGTFSRSPRAIAAR